MSKHTAPFHFDIVASFLRPAELKEAREAFNKGNITREELTAVEDRLITEGRRYRDHGSGEETEKSRIPCDHGWRIPPCYLAPGFHVGL